ncbi:MAG: radical SAM protein [Armatimonadetes bacterium]|nr:radical SAM protein [Armatimonadota bacterium]
MRSAAPAGVEVREIRASSILNKSGISDFAVNCYTGCIHGCRYCYARFMAKFRNEKVPWGRFVDVKVNAAEVLEKQAKRNFSGESVIISSVCDGWQHAEERYGLTRKCLQILLPRNLRISILTKSSLVERDFDLLDRWKEKVELGVTLTTLDEKAREIMEPGAAPVTERLEILDRAAKRGIPIWVFFGPTLPGISDNEQGIEEIMASLAGLPLVRLYFDRLNARYGVWQSLKEALEENNPSLLPLYRKVLFDRDFGPKYEEYLKHSILRAAARHEVAEKVFPCF